MATKQGRPATAGAHPRGTIEHRLARRFDRWEQLARIDNPSWYLDPVTAEQKRSIHLELARAWMSDSRPAHLLKTDVFEEANGRDGLLTDLPATATGRIGMDASYGTVERARRKCAGGVAKFLVADVCDLPFRSASIDAVFSNSTLDHFPSAVEFRRAVGELARVLRPGGRVIITIDNGRNPLYWVLRLTSRLGWTPFELGYTTSQSGLARALMETGLEVVGTRTLIHNPRAISTLIFLALRRLLEARADGPIRGLLRVFSHLERLPTRQFTACFVAACAIKPIEPQAGI